MFPSSSSSDGIDTLNRYIIPIGEFLAGYVGLLFDFKNLRRVEFSKVLILSKMNGWRNITSSIPCIPHVIGMRTYYKMCGFDTGGNIATM